MASVPMVDVATVAMTSVTPGGSRRSPAAWSPLPGTGPDATGAAAVVASSGGVESGSVIGGGPAGLETARVAARRGHRVHLVEQSPSLGGLAALTGPGRPLVDWLEAECRRANVCIDTATPHTSRHGGPIAGEITVQATGGRPGVRTYAIEPGAVPVLDVDDVVRDAAVPDGTVVLHDPIGGPIAVALAETLGERAVLVTPDHIAGNELARNGDLAPANVRLQQRGVRIERRSTLQSVTEIGRAHV